MSGKFTPPLDQAKSEAFAEQMLGVLNCAALSLMLSIGHKTGLFDTMSNLAPSTSEQIARAAGLQERYVREWLAAMVTGRIIEYDAAQRTYRLPAEHAAWLTRVAGPNNLAFQQQYIMLPRDAQRDRLLGEEKRVELCVPQWNQTGEIVCILHCKRSHLK